MTARELNRDWKRLGKKAALQQIAGAKNEDWTPEQWEHYESVENEIEKETLRLFNADPSFCYANKKSVLIFMVLNQRIRIVPLHHIASEVNIQRLVSIIK
jgi:hypothetical protein